MDSYHGARGWPGNFLLSGNTIMEKSHRDQVFKEVARSKFLWCLHCERTYERGKWRNEGDLQMCPYPNCSGDAVIDAWDWATVREYHPDYPETPEIGKCFPLYK